MRGWCIGVAALAVAGCDLNDALSTDVSVVARAGSHVLTVDALAEMVTQEGSRVAIERDVIERYAHRWLEYSLFAQRIAAGDSLLDSTTVRYAMWPAIEQAIVQRYHDHLVAERVQIDSAAVDSVYRAGEQRLVQHVLIRMPADSTRAENARRRAAAVHVQLVAGGSWTEANRVSEDSVAREEGGSLGVLGRGQMVPAFEGAAFALAPGGISGVTQTAYGYHIIRRPPLGEIRDQFAQAVRRILVARMDSQYVDDLMERWRVRVRPGALAQVREATEAPLRVLDSRRVLGTYRGGRFTVADFVRRLQALPVQVHRQLLVARDDQLVAFVRSLIKNEVILREAREAEQRIDDAEYREFKRRLATEIALLREALALDSAMASVRDPELKGRSVAAVVDQYVSAIAQLEQEIVWVPAFLAHRLRSDSEWDVSAAGVERTVERARGLRGREPTTKGELR